MAYLNCSSCGKCVSSGFTPEPTDTPDKGLVVRAWIECPECIEKRTAIAPATDTAAILRLLVWMARWQMDAKDADYRTRITWNGLRTAIQETEETIQGGQS